ncbi:MAG TPA: hypothetical protein VG328_23320 [Stellaceae bacterium]|jgi:hypothetical protein|nr:hypothetical protein [Stellaceae bacterium]
MAFDGDYLRVTIKEAHSLPEAEFRELFCDTVIELIGELDDLFTEDMPFLQQGRTAETLTTAEMREVVLQHQRWFNPTPKPPPPPEPLTLQRAREMIACGMESWLKVDFCEAVRDLNAKHGRRSPLPDVPEECSTQEILGLLEHHPHWFVPLDVP